MYDFISLFSMSFVTVKTYDNHLDAAVLKSKLENEGIQSYLFDELSVTVMPLHTWAMGGIKLKVREADIERTRKVLVKINNTPITDENGNEVCCLSCDSKNINSGYGSLDGWKTILLVFVGILSLVSVPISGSNYYCLECKTGFKT